jgi:hypothetical protein
MHRARNLVAEGFMAEGFVVGEWGGQGNSRAARVRDAASTRKNRFQLEAWLPLQEFIWRGV